MSLLNEEFNISWIVSSGLKKRWVKNKIEDIMLKIDRSKYVDVHTRRRNHDPIIRVRCTKSKRYKILTVHLTRKGPTHANKEVIFVT